MNISLVSMRNGIYPLQSVFATTLEVRLLPVFLVTMLLPGQGLFIKIIQRLVYGETAAHLPTWKNTDYNTLAEARRDNPNEPAGFFRIKHGAVS